MLYLFYCILDLDNDTISERDFICPPKRRRQETEQRLELLSALCNPASVTLTASLEEKNPLFDNYFMKTNDLRYKLQNCTKLQINNETFIKMVLSTIVLYIVL